MSARLFKPVILYPGTTSRPDDHTRDFRPKLTEERDPVATQPTPPAENTDGGDNSDSEGDDPKASSAPGSASNSGDETSNGSTPSAETSNPPESPVESGAPAGAAKAKLLHPSAKPGRTEPPAQA